MQLIYFFNKKFIAFIIYLCTVFPCIANSDDSNNTMHTVMHHIGDAHTWHFATIGEQVLSLPLPVIIYSPDRGIEIFSSHRFWNAQHQRIAYKGYYINENEKIIAIDQDRIFYDFSITKNIAAMLCSVLLLVSVCLITAKRYTKYPKHPPKGISALIDILICYIRDEIAIPNIGIKHYQRFMPYLLTVFFFIWLNNVMGLLPGSANVTGNISITLTLAVFTFMITNKNGSKKYWHHFINPPGAPKWLLPIVVPLELIGLFIKPFSLMIRLFANITAGHIILLSIISLIFIFQNALVGLISVPFGTFMFLLKLIVAFLQAYVFTLLSAIYFGSSIDSSHE